MRYRRHSSKTQSKHQLYPRLHRKLAKRCPTMPHYALSCPPTCCTTVLTCVFALQKRRKGNAAFQDAQAAAADVAQSNSDEQARWLWDSYKNAVGESFLEQEALTGSNLGQAASQILTGTRHTSQQ